MALVVPAEFALTTGVFGSLNGIAGILLSMKRCYKGYKKVGGILEKGEASVSNTQELVKEVAQFVALKVVSIGAFCSIEVRCSEIEQELE